MRSPADDQPLLQKHLSTIFRNVTLCMRDICLAEECCFAVRIYLFRQPTRLRRNGKQPCEGFEPSQGFTG